MHDPIAAVIAACTHGGRLLGVATSTWLVWRLAGGGLESSTALLLAASAIGTAFAFTATSQPRELGGILMLVGQLGAGLRALETLQLVPVLALPGLLTLAGAGLPLAAGVDAEGRYQLSRAAVGYAGLGAVLCALGSFPAAGLVALVYGFPIAFDGFQSGWVGASQAVGAVFFFGFFGGFPILAGLGAVAGLVATGRRPPTDRGAGTLTYLLVYSTGIDLTAALIVALLGRG